MTTDLASTPLSGDEIMRERVWVAADKQGKYELFPEQLPGKPGEGGPIN